MRFIKYESSHAVIEYVAYDENQTASNDVVKITYPNCVRVLIVENANSPTLERACFIPFGDEIEITEKEFFDVFLSSYSSITEVLKDTLAFKLAFQVGDATRKIRDKVVENYLNQLLESEDRTRSPDA